MSSKIVISLCVLMYAVGVPHLELNDTHVFNPDWTPHVRIHEVWQLITNSCIGLLCLWLVWFQRQIILGAILSLLVTGGFMAAYLLRGQYEGSMKYLDGSEKTICEINVGVLGFGVALVLLALTIILETKAKHSANTAPLD